MGNRDDVDAMIAATIEGVRAYRRMRVTELYPRLGMSRTGYYNRLNGTTHWSAGEVKRAADVLGVDVATLYNGLVAGAGFEPATSGLRARHGLTHDFRGGRRTRVRIRCGLHGENGSLGIGGRRDAGCRLHSTSSPADVDHRIGFTPSSPGGYHRPRGTAGTAASGCTGCRPWASTGTHLTDSRTWGVGI